MKYTWITSVIVAVVAGCASGAFAPPIAPELVEPLRVLDLDTGQVMRSPEGVTPRANWLIFRKLSGSARSVTPDDGLGVSGIQSTTSTMFAPAADVWLCTHEMSQAQWGKLAGVVGGPGAPWLSVTSGAGGRTGAIAPEMPAWGLSADVCRDVLADWSAAYPAAPMRLPSSDEWQFACRLSHQAGVWSWGDTAAHAASEAWTAETSGELARPRAIASGAAIAGFFDLHGNVWEWTQQSGQSDHVRGGSWCDNLSSARIDNQRACRHDLGYALAGLRPVLVTP